MFLLPLWLRIWCERFGLHLKPTPQISQHHTAVAVCVDICRFSILRKLKAFEQVEHLYCLALMWVIMCSFKWFFVWYTFLHRSHSKCSWCSLKCSTRLSLWHATPHILHLFKFVCANVRVCVVSCDSSSVWRRKVDSQNWQWNIFFSVECTTLSKLPC